MINEKINEKETKRERDKYIYIYMINEKVSEKETNREYIYIW